MLLNVAQLGELSVTVAADVWLDPAVDTPMLRKVGTRGELSAALVTPIGPRVLLVGRRIVRRQVLA